MIWEKIKLDMWLLLTNFHKVMLDQTSDERARSWLQNSYVILVNKYTRWVWQCHPSFWISKKTIRNLSTYLSAIFNSLLPFLSKSLILSLNSLQITSSIYFFLYNSIISEYLCFTFSHVLSFTPSTHVLSFSLFKSLSTILSLLTGSNSLHHLRCLFSLV